MNSSRHTSSLTFYLHLLLLAAVVLLFATACSERTPQDPSEAAQEEFELSKDNPRVQAVMAVQDRHTARLMAIPEVVGTATGMTDDGRVAIIVYTQSDIMGSALQKGVAAPVPDLIENVPVIVEVSGPFKAMDGGPAHQVNLSRPIQLGVSGGNALDIANGFCCSGTLGALVKNNSGTQFVLSNSHVFAHDTNSGSADPDVAQIGNPINQRGLVDRGCVDNAADHVATLSTLSSLVSGVNVDAAIAQVISGQVRTDGSILDIGVLSQNTVSASLNQKVKKSGRTTGLTRSRVSGLNASITVGYDNECAGQSFNKTFTGQIVVRNLLSRFLNSGDSGSLMVQDVSNNPRTVGLLYAGSSLQAIANPIGPVLSYLNTKGLGTFSMVGN